MKASLQFKNKYTICHRDTFSTMLNIIGKCFFLFFETKRLDSEESSSVEKAFRVIKTSR